MPEQTQRKQYPTKMLLRRIPVMKDGVQKDRTLAVFKARVTKLPSRTNSNGELILSFRTPIKGRVETIGTLCGYLPDATEDGTVFAEVSAFGETAKRLESSLQKTCVDGRYPIITIAGMLSVQQSTDERTGRVYNNAKISLIEYWMPSKYDFPDVTGTLSGSKTAGANTSYASTSAQTVPNAPAPSQTSAQTPAVPAVGVDQTQMMQMFQAFMASQMAAGVQMPAAQGVSAAVAVAQPNSQSNQLVEFGDGDLFFDEDDMDI